MTAVPTFAGPADSLPSSQMKEQLSIAYASMVVAASGCTIASFSTDHDAVDVGVRSSASYPEIDEPIFDIQLKCTSQDIIRSDYVVWSLDKRTHRKITNPKRMAPAILGVLVVPEDAGTWLDHDESRLITEGAMYYIRGNDIPPLPDGQGSISVRIPRNNLFNVDSLLKIMADIGNDRM